MRHVLPGSEGRVCRGLSRGSLPVRNTGEMGSWPGSSSRVICGVPGGDSVANRRDILLKLKFWHACILRLILYQSVCCCQTALTEVKADVQHSPDLQADFHSCHTQKKIVHKLFICICVQAFRQACSHLSRGLMICSVSACAVLKLRLLLDLACLSLPAPLLSGTACCSLMTRKGRVRVIG